jgi:hypothetical protein
MKITGPRKIPSLCQICLEWPVAAWRWAKAGSGALALGAVWMLAGSCLATEPPTPASLSSHAFLVHGSTNSEFDGNHLYDLVIVEPKGRGPQGFRFQIVLDSATRGAESSLDLAAGEGGLLVTARDVDGIGNDLDLIIKTARSFTPVGVWINDHHGGFTKADTGVYAPSIWSDGPFMLSLNSPDILQGAILLWHQSYINPSAQRCPGERRAHQAFIDLPDLNMPSRLTADPQQTRGPPSPFSTNS